MKQGFPWFWRKYFQPMFYSKTWAIKDPIMDNEQIDLNRCKGWTLLDCTLVLLQSTYMNYNFDLTTNLHHHTPCTTKHLHQCSIGNSPSQMRETESLIYLWCLTLSCWEWAPQRISKNTLGVCISVTTQSNFLVSQFLSDEVISNYYWPGL